MGPCKYVVYIPFTRTKTAFDLLMNKYFYFYDGWSMNTYEYVILCVK